MFYKIDDILFYTEEKEINFINVEDIKQENKLLVKENIKLQKEIREYQKKLSKYNKIVNQLEDMVVKLSKYIEDKKC